MEEDPKPKRRWKNTKQLVACVCITSVSTHTNLFFGWNWRCIGSSECHDHCIVCRCKLKTIMKIKMTFKSDDYYDDYTTTTTTAWVAWIACVAWLGWTYIWPRWWNTSTAEAFFPSKALHFAPLIFWNVCFLFIVSIVSSLALCVLTFHLFPCRIKLEMLNSLLSHYAITCSSWLTDWLVSKQQNSFIDMWL